MQKNGARAMLRSVDNKKAPPDWLTVDQVADVFSCSRDIIVTAMNQNALAFGTDSADNLRCDPLSVEGLRRRLARIQERAGRLDAREAERIRLCLEGTARRKLRALAAGECFDDHPSIPPPPAGWLEADDPLYHLFVAGLLGLKPPPKGAERAVASVGLPPLVPTEPDPEDHPEIIPPPNFFR